MLHFFQGKGLLLGVLIFMSSFHHLYSQDFWDLMQEEQVNYHKVKEKADDYFATHPKGKGSGFKYYSRWAYWAQRKMDSEGYIISDKVIDLEQKRFGLDDSFRMIHHLLSQHAL